MATRSVKSTAKSNSVGVNSVAVNSVAVNSAAVNGESDKYYRFKETPDQLQKILQIFESLLQKQKTSKIWAWVFLFLFVDLAIVAMWQLEWRWYLVATVTKLALFTYFGIYLLGKLVLPTRSVNPQGRSLKSLFSLFVPIGVTIFFFGVNLDPRALGALPHPSTSPALAIWIYLFGLAVIGVVSQMMKIRRLGKGALQRAEIDFLTRTLNPLLAEVPVDQRCVLICNPFPALWSEHEEPGLRGARPVTSDTILKSSLSLGNDRTISIAAIHRRKIKGQRKNKGWKHKVKIACVITDPVVQTIDRPKFLRLLHQESNWQPDSATAKDLYFRAPILGKDDPATEILDGAIAISWDYMAVKLSGTLSRKDLLCPEAIHAGIQKVSRALVQATAGETRPSATSS